MQTTDISAPQQGNNHRQPAWLNKINMKTKYDNMQTTTIRTQLALLLASLPMFVLAPMAQAAPITVAHFSFDSWSGRTDAWPQNGGVYNVATHHAWEITDVAGWNVTDLSGNDYAGVIATSGELNYWFGGPSTPGDNSVGMLTGQGNISQVIFPKYSAGLQRVRPLSVSTPTVATARPRILTTRCKLRLTETC